MSSARRLTGFISVFAILCGAALAGPGSLTRFGFGTPGSGNLTPRIWADGTLSAGNANFAVTLDNALGGSLGVLLIGTVETELPVAGVTLLTTPLQIVPTTLTGQPGLPGDGSASVPLPIPAGLDVSGMNVLFQWLVRDTGGPVTLSASDGLRATGAEPTRVFGLGGGAPGPLFGVDPDNGQVDNLGNGLGSNGVTDLAVSPDGTTAVVPVVLGGGTGEFAILDLQDGGSLLGSVSVTGVPNGVEVTPDGRRAYGITAGAAGTLFGAIHEIDIDRGSATFGQKIGQVTNYPAGADTLENLGISADGLRLTAAVFGLGDTPAVLVVDIDPLSATFNQVTRHIIMSTLPLGSAPLVADVELNANGSTAYALLLFLGNVHGELALIDTGSGTLLGTGQNVGYFPIDVDIDPLDRYAFIAAPNSDEITRVSIDPAAPDYLATVSTGSIGPGRIWQVAFSADGSRVYASDLDNSTILELGTESMAVLNTFVVGQPLGNGLVVR